jgi:hypothetical protein
VNCKLAGTGNYYVHAVEFARELELPMERALTGRGKTGIRREFPLAI